MALQDWSWQQIEEMVALHNWRCLSRDWTLLDWVERGVVRIQTHPETAGTQRASANTTEVQTSNQDAKGSFDFKVRNYTI